MRMLPHVKTRHVLRTAVVLIALSGGAAGVSPAVGLQQHTPDPNSAPGALSGTVVAQENNAPLGLATVTLVPRPAGVFPATIGASSSLTGSRSVLTDERGAYRFPGITPGSYRLYVRRIGYRPAILDIDLEDSQGLHLSVGLSVAPIRLEAVTTTADPADPFGRDDAARAAPASFHPNGERRFREAEATQIRRRVDELPNSDRSERFDYFIDQVAVCRIPVRRQDLPPRCSGDANFF